MTLPTQAEPVTFSGRVFSIGDVELMRRMTEEFSALAVTEIAQTICELLDPQRIREYREREDVQVSR